MLTQKRPVIGMMIVAVATMIPVDFRMVAGQPPGKFDKLAAEDRKVFNERFQKEIWPLLVRNGKDGCVGCHNGQKTTALRFSNNAGKDFPMLVAEGFFLKNDPGSLLERITDKSKTRRMPPDNRPGWTADEVRLLRAFVDDLDRKNKP